MGGEAHRGLFVGIGVFLRWSLQSVTQPCGKRRAIVSRPRIEHGRVHHRIGSCRNGWPRRCPHHRILNRPIPQHRDARRRVIDGHPLGYGIKVQLDDGMLKGRSQRDQLIVNGIGCAGTQHRCVEHQPIRKLIDRHCRDKIPFGTEIRLFDRVHPWFQQLVHGERVVSIHAEEVQSIIESRSRNGCGIIAETLQHIDRLCKPSIVHQDSVVARTHDNRGGSINFNGIENERIIIIAVVDAHSIANACPVQTDPIIAVPPFDLERTVDPRTRIAGPNENIVSSPEIDFDVAGKGSIHRVDHNCIVAVVQLNRHRRDGWEIVRGVDRA